jgi:hypothetical protein
MEWEALRGRRRAGAQQARLLQDVLGRVAAEPDPITALQAGFMAEVASVLETPWNMSTSADLAFPRTRGERPENFEEAQQFEAALFRAVVADPVVHRAMMEVGQLLQPHTRLQQPDIMRRIEAEGRDPLSPWAPAFAGVARRAAGSRCRPGFKPRGRPHAPASTTSSSLSGST